MNSNDKYNAPTANILALSVFEITCDKSTMVYMATTQLYLYNSVPMKSYDIRTWKTSSGSSIEVINVHTSIQ